MFLQYVVNDNDICNEINNYLNYFDKETWKKYTGISEFVLETDDRGNAGYFPSDFSEKRDVTIALNICTYHRNKQIKQNIEKLLKMKFFDVDEKEYYGHLHIFIVDNGSELECIDNGFVKVMYNRNTGGSGGFQKGLEVIRSSEISFTNVVFMDDDADFIPETFYRLYALLVYMKPEYYNRSIPGRMFCLDNPSYQYTAAEIWNGGDLKHIGFMQDMADFDSIDHVRLNDADDADYGGWWFCCFPYDFCKNNDIMPVFLHCDDVEYGLTVKQYCSAGPIILNGIQVWHETAVYRQSPIIQYYDTRNPLFVNDEQGIMSEPSEVYNKWFSKITDFHVREDYASEYYTIMGMLDYLKGIRYLYRIDPEKKHKKLSQARISRLRNSVLWRIVRLRFRWKDYLR